MTNRTYFRWRCTRRGYRVDEHEGPGGCRVLVPDVPDWTAHANRIELVRTLRPLSRLD